MYHVNFLLKKKIKMFKNTFFNYKIKTEIKTITATAIKKELKYSLMSGGDTCIAEPNLEVLPLQ